MAIERLGPYQIEKLLGRGGMGAVYIGVHAESGEKTAVKVLAAHLSDDLGFRERFKSEVESLKKLLHPNIVRLIGFGEEQGDLYYAMELVAGRSLQDELAAGRRFSWRDAVKIGVQVAAALKHAHDRGVIHRDLKPANLLINSADHVWLTDFGIAKLYGGTSMTADGSVLGTADYMAPEQAIGKGITSRCDLYSFGCVLYALLAGRPPFQGKSLPEMIHALRYEKPTPVRRLAPDTPAELELLIQQLLEKDPQDRVPTAVAVANRLKAMEHALSLETRIAPLEGDDFQLAPLADPRRTQIGFAGGTELAQGVTRDMPAALGENDLQIISPSSPTHVPPPLGEEPYSLATQASQAPPLAPIVPAPAPPKASRFTLVSEAELRGLSPESDAEDGWKQWIKLGALAVLLLVCLGAVVAFATRRPSADQLYSRIQTAASGDLEDLLAAEEVLLDFQTRFSGDPRAAEVRDRLEDVELHRLQKQFELRARRTADPSALTPIERAYLDAQRSYADDPEFALRKFQALLDVFAADDNPADDNPAADLPEKAASKRCLELARRQIASLTEVVAKSNQLQRLAIRRQLERARRLKPADPVAARKITEGIITLFGDKAWAADLVAEARQLAVSEAPRDP